jgi:hypothetical protein
MKDSAAGRDERPGWNSNVADVKRTISGETPGATDVQSPEQTRESVRDGPLVCFVECGQQAALLCARRQHAIVPDTSAEAVGITIGRANNRATNEQIARCHKPLRKTSVIQARE